MFCASEQHIADKAVVNLAVNLLNILFLPVVMKKVLIVYPPFCTPASPPYSVTGIFSFLKANLPAGSVSVLDLNAFFHNLAFRNYGDYFRSLKEKYDPVEYSEVVKEYSALSKELYSANNKKVVDGNNPDLFDELMKIVVSEKPDFVAFSIVYSSQSFYAVSMIKELRKLGIKTVVGGPCVNSKLKEAADYSLCNEMELLELVRGEKVSHESLNFDYAIDFSAYNLESYFTPVPIIPVKTSSGCYYKQCAFCTHHTNLPYFEFPVGKIVEAIVLSRQKHFFIIDDMIHKKRLLELADAFIPLGISWTCQLKPTSDLDMETLKTLAKSGLKMVMWGVESGCDRVLCMMRKGTNKKDVAKVLSDAHSVGIKNVAYIIFGFPTESKEDFLETIDFLKDNSGNIDLVLPSIFGLQKGSAVFAAPADFGITNITEKERTVLDPSIAYEVKEGLTNAQASILRGKYKRTLDKLNRYPKEMNFFREHMLWLVSKTD